MDAVGHGNFLLSTVFQFMLLDIHSIALDFPSIYAFCLLTATLQQLCFNPGDVHALRLELELCTAMARFMRMC